MDYWCEKRLREPHVRCTDGHRFVLRQDWPPIVPAARGRLIRRNSGEFQGIISFRQS